MPLNVLDNKGLVLTIYPFENLSDHNDYQIFCKAFWVDLITELSRFRHLQIIDYLSVNEVLPKAGHDGESFFKQHTDYHINGSFRRERGKLTINARLINSKTLQLVWSDNFSGSDNEIFDLQDNLLQKIVAALQHQLSQDLLSHIRKKPRTTLKVYECCLYGVEELKKGTAVSDVKAREYFKQAISIDPDYSLAYSGMSMSYFNEWSCRLWDRWDISRNGARKYALRAIELDKNDYIALMILGRTYLFSEEYDKAEHCLRKSIQLNPNDSSNLIQIAFWMCYLGLFREAEQLYRHAQKLNQIYQDQHLEYGMFIYFLTGKFKTSLQLAEQIPSESTWVDFNVYIGANYFHLGQPGKAREYWKKFVKEFEMKIYNGVGELEPEALKWQKMINPFKVPTHLEPFWNFVEVNQQTPTETGKSNKTLTESATFIRNGEIWNIHFNGENVIMKDLKGFYDIARLLNEPEKEFHCIELMGAFLIDGARHLAIDEKAKKNYRQKLSELKEEIEIAEELGQTDELKLLYAKYDQLVDYLTGSLGLAGKPRVVGSSVEKSRTAVTWRIRNAIKKIEHVHPQLAKHLHHSIKTGTLCTYTPEKPFYWKTLT